MTSPIQTIFQTGTWRLAPLFTYTIAIGCNGSVGEETPADGTTPGALPQATAGAPGTVPGIDDPGVTNPAAPGTTAAAPGGGGVAPGPGLVPGEIGPYDRAASPLARLTNDEYFVSAISLLNIPADAPELDDARATMMAEPLVGGLRNDVNGQLLTQLGISGYTNVASAIADVFLAGVSSEADLRGLLNCANGTMSECATLFGQDLMRRAFRRPVTDDELATMQTLVDRYDEAASAADNPNSLDAHLIRIKTVVRYTLLSPDFLLIIERGTPTGQLNSYEIATRMSYFLFGEAPDDSLIAAAGADLLQDPTARLDHVDRLLESESGRERFGQAMVSWLGIKDGLEPASVEALSGFIADWFSSGKPLADLYQAPVTVRHTDGTETEEPLGVLGSEAFLASHTSFPTPAFITRGEFVVEELLCFQLPQDIPAEAVESDQRMTDLEVFEEHNKQACATCHRIFDNYGAALNQFDGETGLYEPGPTELGSGFELFNLGGITGVVDGPQDLAAVIGSSERASQCMAELWYRSAMRRSLHPAKDDARIVGELMDVWSASGDTSLKSFLRTVVASEHFVTFVPDVL